MAEFNEVGTRLIYDISNFSTNIQEQIKLTEEAKKTTDDLTKKIKESSTAQADAIEKVVEAQKKSINQAKEVSKEQDKVSGSTKKLTKEKIALLRQYSTEKAALKDAFRNYQIFGTSLNDTANLIKGLSKTSGIFIRVLGKFKVALASTGIGAIVIALGALFTYLTKTQEGMDKLRKITAQFGAVVSVITDRFAKFGKSLADGSFFKKAGSNILGFLTNPLKQTRQALENVRDGFREVAEEISEEVKKTGELEDRKTKLRDLERQIRIETAEQRKEIKALNLVAEDVTKSYEERIAAAEKAGKLERDLIQAQLSAENERVKIIQEKMALSENLAADEDELAEAIIKRAELENTSLEQQTTLQNKLNQLINDRARAFQSLVQEYKTGLEELAESLGTIAQQSDEEAFLSQRDALIQELESKRDALIQIANQVGKPTEQIREGYKQLIDYISGRDFENAVQSVSSGSIGTFDVPVREITIKAEPDTTIEPDPTLLEKFRILNDIILTELGIDPEQAQAIIDSVQVVLNKSLDLLAQANSRRIEENERYLDSIREQKEALKESLDRELELKEKGAANDVDLLQRQISEKEKIEQDALKRSEQLKKRQAQIQLVQDIAQAGQSLLTASAQIINAHAKIPFAGIPIALAFIGTMFGAFAKYKAAAKNTVRLSKGLKSINEALGFIDKGGQDDHHREGYHVTDQFGNDTGVRLGGNEMVIPSEASLLHEQGLKNLGRNPRDYSIVRNFEKSRRALGYISESSNTAKTLSSIEQKIEEQTIRIIDAIKNKPIAYVIDENSKKVVLLSGDKKDIFNL